MILVLFWLVAMVFLAAGTVAFQGYIYTEPVQGIIWRAPAAGTAITSSAPGVMLDYGSPGWYRTLLEFNPREDRKPYRDLITEPRPGEQTYKLAKNPRASKSTCSMADPMAASLSGRPYRVIGKDGRQEDAYEPTSKRKKMPRAKRPGASRPKPACRCITATKGQAGS